jgi:hypothetical protein
MDKIALKKLDWKTWAIIGLGGVAVIATGAFVTQAKYAALGRQVHRNVTKFLIDSGARIESGVISGGFVNLPMKTHIAVNSTVLSLIGMITDEAGGRPPLNPATGDDEPVNTGRRSGVSADASADVGGSPPPPSAAKKRGSAAATSVQSLTTLPDDGGYANRPKGGSHEYNPSEFTPQREKPKGEVDLFAGDG